MYYNMMCIQKDFLHADQKKERATKKNKSADFIAQKIYAFS